MLRPLPSRLDFRNPNLTDALLSDWPVSWTVSLMGQGEADPLARFGDNVREARHRVGWTQERLGLAADLHPTEINRMERGRRNPGVLTLVKLARGLRVPAADLLKGL